MGILDIFKRKKVESVKNPLSEGPTKTNTKSQKSTTKTPAAPKKPRKKKIVAPIASPLTATEIAKAEATRKGEPWVTVLDVEIDLDNISNGAFNLDWNDYFVAKLVRAGYKGTDIEMVDQWFSDLCRNVLQENYEQDQADPTNRTR